MAKGHKMEGIIKERDHSTFQAIRNMWNKIILGWNSVVQSDENKRLKLVNSNIVQWTG